MAMGNPALASHLNNLKFRFDITKAAQRELDTFLARGFNVFNFIRPKEIDLSEILRELLDPNGQHGQGPVFLSRFLNIVQLSTETDLARARVKREVRTQLIASNQRRIDITIELGSNFAVGIENKPWARDQKDQVKDYCDQLAKQYKGNFLMVYLTPEGSKPVSLSEEQRDQLLKPARKLFCLSHIRGIKEWLNLCQRECQADKIRWFLKDFERFVDLSFGPEGVTMQGDEFGKVLAEYALERPENLETILPVAANVEQIRRQLIVHFTVALEEKLKSVLDGGWILENDFRQGFLTGYKEVRARKDGWGNGRYVCLQTHNLKEVCIGLTRGETGSWPKDDAFVKARLDETGDPGMINSTWGWWRMLGSLDIPYGDWTSDTTLKLMHWKSSNTVDYYKENFLRVANVAAEILG